LAKHHLWQGNKVDFVAIGKKANDILKKKATKVIAKP